MNVFGYLISIDFMTIIFLYFHLSFNLKLGFCYCYRVSLRVVVSTLSLHWEM